jgi:hypothetical protein
MMTTKWHRVLAVAGIVVCALLVAATDAQTEEPAPLINLAPVDTASQKPAVLSKVRKLNKLARKALRSGKYEDAITQSLAAASLDPGSIAARYRLSNAYALGGKPEHGFAVLKQFQDAQGTCMACVDRLARARVDHDWGAYHSDSRFVAVTETTAVVPTVEEAAASLIKGVESGTIDAYASLVHPRKRVKVGGSTWTSVHSDYFTVEVAHRMFRGIKGLERGIGAFRRAKLRKTKPFKCRKIWDGFMRCDVEAQRRGVAISSVDYKASGGGVFFLSEIIFSTDQGFEGTEEIMGCDDGSCLEEEE